MAHVRTQIRDALKALLTGLPTTGTHVHVNRLQPLPQNGLPALIIRTEDESITAATMHAPAMLDRALTINIEAVASAGAALDDTLDQIALEVEQALTASPSARTLGGLVKTLRTDSISIDLDGAGDLPVGRAQLRYEARYFVQDNAPDVAI